MKKEKRGNFISAAAVILVFCVFAVSVLSVLLSGAGAYRRLTERDRLSYDSRTCIQMVATKVRQAPAPDCVMLSDYGDGNGIVISQIIDGREYWDRIYCHDGWLMELFAASHGDFNPEDGEKLVKARGMWVSEDDGMLTITIVDGNGKTAHQRLSIRGGGETP
ncbi:MAG: DUF4860 domain-containing protein [Oscillospiraceae bacterium]|nr:DUF4860 domain-containing protein [Oscillospiraceae bacterium]